MPRRPKKQKYERPDPIIENGEEKFEVEKIIDHYVDEDGANMYKIRWKGYPPDDDTWENEDSVIGCSEVLNEYLKSLTAPKAKQRRRSMSVQRKQKLPSNEPQLSKVEEPEPVGPVISPDPVIDFEEPPCANNDDLISLPNNVEIVERVSLDRFLESHQGSIYFTEYSYYREIKNHSMLMMTHAENEDFCIQKLESSIAFFYMFVELDKYNAPYFIFKQKHGPYFGWLPAENAHSDFPNLFNRIAQMLTNYENIMSLIYSSIKQEEGLATDYSEQFSRKFSNAIEFRDAIENDEVLKEQVLQGLETRKQLFILKCQERMGIVLGTSIRSSSVMDQEMNDFYEREKDECPFIDIKEFKYICKSAWKRFKSTIPIAHTY